MKSIRPRRRQDYKAQLLAEIAPSIDTDRWSEDLHQVHRGGPSVRRRIQTKDRGWIELDRAAGVVRTWGRPGRAVELARAIADAEGWSVDWLPQTGDVKATSTVRSLRRPAVDLEAWWRERGYHAVRAEDGVWVDAGPDARIQDVGDQVRLHGTLTPDAARAIVTKAAEGWGGEAELTGDWSQPDQDALWLEAQRVGVRLDRCSPSSQALAAWNDERSATAEREATLGVVRAETGPAQRLRNAAAGDVEALQKLDPDLRAFVSSYLDDDQRKELARSDVADIVPELRKFRSLGAEERKRDGQDHSSVNDIRPRDRDISPEMGM